MQIFKRGYKCDSMQVFLPISFSVIGDLVFHFRSTQKNNADQIDQHSRNSHPDSINRITMSSERKVALVTGITGQDGSYLAEFLLEKGYTVS